VQLRLCAVYYVICIKDHSMIHLSLISVHCRVQGEKGVNSRVNTKHSIITWCTTHNKVEPRSILI
jgi:hypothetical protein